MSGIKEQVDLDQLAGRVQAEIARHRTLPEAPEFRSVVEETSTRTANFEDPASRPKTIAELTAFHDEEFVRAAYASILGREPDGSGREHSLALLRSGARGKIDILGALRFSEEGEKCGVDIPGLKRAYLLSRSFRLPVIGYGFRFLHVFLRLPVLLSNMQEFEAYANCRFTRLQQENKRFAAHLDSRLAQLLEQRQEQLHVLAELQRQLARLAFTKADRTALSALAEQLGALSSSKVDRDELMSRCSELANQLNALSSSKVDKSEIAALTASNETVLEIQRQLSRVQFSKAERNKVDALETLLLADLAKKADAQRLMELAGLVGTKASRQDFRELAERLSLKEKTDREQVVQLAERIDTKAEQQQMAELAAQVGAKAEQQQVAELAVQIGTKAEQQQMAELAAQVGAKAEQQQVAELTVQIGTKAEQQQVAELAAQVGTKAEQQQVAELAAQVGTKAEQLQVAELAAQVGTKAEQLQVAELAAQISTKAEQQNLADLAELVRTKAEQKHLEEVNWRVSTKADQQQVIELAERLNTKAEQQHLTELADRLNAEGSQRINEISSQLAVRAHQVDLSAVEARVVACESSGVAPAVIQSLSDGLQHLKKQTDYHKLTLVDQQRRLAIFLEQARKRLPEPFTPEQLKEIVNEEQHSLDSLYVAFEDRFRGTRADIKERSRVFLPYVQAALLRTRKAPVLDIACGRGEWLELLTESGIGTYGVDFNRVFVQQCSDNGLNVVQGDALEYLREQKNHSFSAVTSFHFVEHVDFKTLVALMDEILRVLKPGGLALFETPNARNLLVTAGDFYRDPTHRTPLFPDTLEALAEFRGFSNSTIYCFNEDRTVLQPLREYSFSDLNDYVRVSRDAVWIGTKPA